MANTLEKKLTHDNFVTEKADVIKSRLLGDYNAKGKYIINKKIVEELIDLKKAKKESYNNSIFVTAKTKEGRLIDFQIDFKKNSNSNLAAAVLSTLEPVEKQGGRLTNIIKTSIAKFTDELAPDFVSRALTTFNVVYDAEAGGKERDADQLDDAYILKRNMLLKALDGLTEESYNAIYEDYFTQRINLLKKTNNAYSKKVLAIFNEEFSKISEHFLVDKKSKKVKNYKAMNELLDKAFEDLEGMEIYSEQEKQYRERILPILGMFISSAERVRKSAQQNVLDEFPRRTKEALTDTLVDMKQSEESAMDQDVVEKNKKQVKKSIDKKFDSIDDRVSDLYDSDHKDLTREHAPTSVEHTADSSSVADFVSTYDRIVSGIENSGSFSDFVDAAEDLWDSRPEEFIDRARRRGGETDVSGKKGHNAFDFDSVEAEDVKKATQAFDDMDDMDEMDEMSNDTAEKFKNVYKDATQGFQAGKADFIAGAKAAYAKQPHRK